MAPGATVVPVATNSHHPRSGTSSIIPGRRRSSSTAACAALDGAGITTLATDTAVDGVADFDAEVASAAPILVSTERLPEDTIAEILYTSGTTRTPQGPRTPAIVTPDRDDHRHRPVDHP